MTAYTEHQQYFIPNQTTYLLRFPHAILTKYHGKDELDVTLDDEIMYFICSPLIEQNIDYNYCLDWKDETNSILSIILNVNGATFDPLFVLNSLRENNRIEGLEMIKKTPYNEEMVYKSEL